MRTDLLELLACPECRGPLELEVGQASESDGVVEGKLHCSACGASYPITDGIPRLVTGAARSGGAAIASHFAEEFTALAADDRDLDPPEVLEQLFYSRTGLDLHRRLLHGKVVLDAGCGMGRFTRVAAAAGAVRVVGLDLGDHIERAARYCRDLPNVDFVQGSVLDPPLRAGTFDYVFSLGVLHHTDDPRRACRRLGELVGPHGALSLWVYPPDYWGGHIRGPVNRFVNRRIARLPAPRALTACRRWLYPLGRAQMAVARYPWLKVALAPLFVVSVPRHPRREVMLATIFDHFGPAVISTHDYDEVARWLRDAGFTRLRKVPVPTAWFAQR